MRRRGFTLIELIVGIALFLLIALGVWRGFYYVSELIRVGRIQSVAVALASEQIELIRNLPYDDVGIIGGIPTGKLPRTKEFNRDNINFLLEFTVRNIDDPFDGLFPEDPSPADYKSVEIEITYPDHPSLPPTRLITTVAPENLETASTNGALFIQVINASGQPIKQADVFIFNEELIPIISINEKTDDNGWLKIVDAPPSFEAYQITVSKAGYSTDQTYPPDDPSNPNPSKPHATVVVQQVTQITFIIDKLSILNIFTVDEYCTRKGNVNFQMRGTKLIGTNPDVYKYEENLQTNSLGEKSISNLEWDNYSINITDTNYLFAGSIPLVPFNLIPETTLDLFLIVTQEQPKAVLVKVRDASTLLPISGAEIKMQKPGWEQTLFSGRGHLRQKDWRGGSGQENFVEENKYWSQNGNIATSTELTLIKIGPNYQTNGWLVSSTYDLGMASNFYNIFWRPLDQPAETEVKFQIATSDTNPPEEDWEFLGPDGTNNTFYTLANNNINPIHHHDRYLRYKIFLSTTDSRNTPSISDLAITFSSDCVPSGQSFFHGLPAASNWTLTVAKEGYQTHTENVNVTIDWQERTVDLYPED